MLEINPSPRPAGADREAAPGKDPGIVDCREIGHGRAQGAGGQAGNSPAALNSLPDEVFGGLHYYRDQVAAMADPTGERPADVEKRAILERLLGEITATPYPRKRELELEFGLGAEALPSVIPAGRANSYIVVAGA